MKTGNRKSLAALMIAFALMAGFAACGKAGTESAAPAEGPAEQTQPAAAQKQEEKKAPEPAQTEDYAAVYAPVLNEVYEILYNGYDSETDYAYDPTGLMEMVGWIERDTLLAGVGYSIRDLSGDGIPELMIGTVAGETSPDGSDIGVILNGYTCKEHSPVVFLTGWGRNRYSWLGENRFFNTGSSGAMYSIFASYHLSKDGTELVCEDYYFTHEKDETFQEIAIFHNQTGAWDVDVSEELSISDEEFWKLMNDYEAQCVPMELTPFADYVYTGAMQLKEKQAVRVDYLADVAAELDSYEKAADYFPEFYPEGTEFETTVVFRSDAGVRDFKLLTLELRDVDDNGKAHFEAVTLFHLPSLKAGVPLAVPVSFPGDIPSTGFSYTDEEGTTHQFTLSMSGKDGSLVVAPFD